MPRKLVDITGTRYGRLVAIKYAGQNKYKQFLWKCVCDCGAEVIVSASHLNNCYVKSCGCLRRDESRQRKTIHGHRYERAYGIWKHMLKRCYNQEDGGYDYYGKRGIRVCDEWQNSYESFRDWSLANRYADDLSLDRIDNDGNYTPENCRWVDHYTQMNNTRRSRHISYKNISHTISEWSRILGVHKATLRDRINRGDMSDFDNYFSK